jgi:hypothetical protein
MSDMNPAIIAGTRIAVEFLTVWTESDQQFAITYIDGVLNDPNGPGVPSIIAGQLNVGAALMVMLAEARGAVTPNDISMMAGETLRALYRDLAQ